jgi:hypothetical protein
MKLRPEAEHDAQTTMLVARQVAVFNGQIWDRLSDKTKYQLLTLAASIRATIERRR